jgi:hypothetical protein
MMRFEPQEDPGIDPGDRVARDELATAVHSLRGAELRQALEYVEGLREQAPETGEVRKKP